MPDNMSPGSFFATYPSKRRQKGTPSRFAGAGRDGYSCMVSNITTHYGAKKNYRTAMIFFRKM